MKLKYPLVLASQSPRRLNLLKERGFEPVVDPSGIDEDVPENLNFIETAVFLAEEKARSVAERYGNQKVVVLGADSIVVKDEKLYGKPNDIKEAETFLKELSGNWHEVITGISCYLPKEKRSVSSYEVTEVLFRKLAIEEIRDYIRTQPPLDKAGAYGIQDNGAFFVEKISGCFFNVVGLPLVKLLECWKKIDCINYEY